MLLKILKISTTDGLVATGVDSQPYGNWFDPFPLGPIPGIFPKENSPSSLTSIGGVHSAVDKFLGTGLSQTPALLAGPNE